MLPFTEGFGQPHLHQWGSLSAGRVIAQPWTSPRGGFPTLEHFLRYACAPSPLLGSILPPQPAQCLWLSLGEENFPVLLLPHTGWPGIWILSHTSSAAQRCVGEQYIPFIGRATGQRKERSKPPPFPSPGVCWFPFFSPRHTSSAAAQPLALP